MLELFLDTETLPCIDERLKKEIADSVQMPKNISKAETIAKWEAEDKPKLVEEALAKTSLDGTYGRACCITFAFNDEPVQGFIDRSEAVVLHKFFAKIVGTCKISEKVTVIGHNIFGFDLRFIWQRAIVNNIKPPICLPWTEKAWSDNIRDTMIMWNPATDKRISLHKLCLALDIESPKDKNDMDGSDIVYLWAKRDYDKILKYGIDDVESMRKCYRRMTV